MEKRKLYSNEVKEKAVNSSFIHKNQRGEYEILDPNTRTCTKIAIQQ